MGNEWPLVFIHQTHTEQPITVGSQQKMYNETPSANPTKGTPHAIVMVFRQYPGTGTRRAETRLFIATLRLG